MNTTSDVLFTYRVSVHQSNYIHTFFMDPGKGHHSLDYQSDVSLPPSLLAKQEEMTEVLPHTRQVPMKARHQCIT